MSRFTIYLNDIYQYPSPVELEWLQVQIVRVIDSYHLLPSIYPMQIVNGTSIPATIQLFPSDGNIFSRYFTKTHPSLKQEAG